MMKTSTKLLAAMCMTAMAGMAGATDAPKAEHMAKPMTTQECNAYMAKQAQPKASTDEMAKQNEAYCANRLEKTMARQNGSPSMTDSSHSKM